MMLSLLSYIDEPLINETDYYKNLYDNWINYNQGSKTLNAYLKLDDKVEKYLKIKGFYPAYHMNKKSWISIILDGSVSTEIIEKLVETSYNNLNDIMNKKYYKEVFEYLTKIPKGKVVTYKQIAEHLGNKKLARVVGNILHKNPDGDKYPCFKVVNSQGGLTDAFAFNGIEKQKRRLENDGVKVANYKVDLDMYQWKEKK